MNKSGEIQEKLFEVDNRGERTCDRGKEFKLQIKDEKRNNHVTGIGVMHCLNHRPSPCTHCTSFNLKPPSMLGK